MKKISLFLSALLISAISMAATVTMDFTSAAGLEKIGIAYPTTDAGNGAYSTDLVEGKAEKFCKENDILLTAFDCEAEEILCRLDPYGTEIL